MVLSDWRARGYLPKCLTSALVVPVCKKAFKRSFYFFTQFNVSSAGAGIQKAGPAHNAVSAHRGLPWRCPHSSKAAGGGQNRQVGIYHCSRLSCSWIQSPASQAVWFHQKNFEHFLRNRQIPVPITTFSRKIDTGNPASKPGACDPSNFCCSPLTCFYR